MIGRQPDTSWQKTEQTTKMLIKSTKTNPLKLKTKKHDPSNKPGIISDGQQRLTDRAQHVVHCAHH